MAEVKDKGSSHDSSHVVVAKLGNAGTSTSVATDQQQGASRQRIPAGNSELLFDYASLRASPCLLEQRSYAILTYLALEQAPKPSSQPWLQLGGDGCFPHG